ncbi:MAG: hypothetical protein D6766_05295 [Verrucomicrobia bacterium]|nr:MAG: hypothetical protein D6766_05295 [Verrucomicrobiota bacterium]
MVDLFIPPTRPSQPYAATATAVFHQTEAGGAWHQIYRPPLQAQRVAGLAGYARSSKVLYVAHGAGVARTRDAGGSWEELLPLGLGADSGSFVALTVNPTNRYEAVLAHEHALWRVAGPGGMFEPLELQEQTGTIRAAAYAGVAPARLLVVGAKGVFLETDRGHWQQLELDLGGPRHAVVAPNAPLYLVRGLSRLWVGDFSRPGYGQLLDVALPADVSGVAIDCAAQGFLWYSVSNRLWQVDLTTPSAPPQVLRTSSATPTLLRAHPREAAVVLWAEGPQVFQTQAPLAAPEGASRLPLNPNVFQPVPMHTLQLQTPVSAGAAPSLSQVLDEVLAAEPPLQQVTRAALEQARLDPDRVLAWQRDARKSHWLPQVRLGGGFREYSLDQNMIVDGVDRYGIPTHDDLRLNDTTRPFGYLGVTLVWDLDRLRYDPEQVDITREARYQAKYRTDLLSQVSQLYYARIDTLVKLRAHAGSLNETDAVALRLKLRETTELLNALCGRPLLAPDPTGQTTGAPPSRP